VAGKKRDDGEYSGKINKGGNYMPLKDRLQQDLINAIKSYDTLKVSLIRLVKAAITSMEATLGHQLEDDEVIEVLVNEAKQRLDSIPEYERSGRADIVASLKQEVAILQEYLPGQLKK
jgi:uncharacterized protein YqeY